MGRTRWFFAGCIFLLVGSLSWGQCAAGGTAVSNPSIVPAGAFQQTAAHITSGDAFGDGANFGFLTKITIVNLSSSANTVVLNDISQSGSLIDSCSYSIGGNGTLRITQGKLGSAPETHWALVGSQSQVAVNQFFELTRPAGVVNTVGFNDVAPRGSYTFPVELQNSPFHTLGLAVANPNNSNNTVTVTLFDSTGKSLGSKSQTLPAFGQVAEDLLTSTNPLSVVSLLPSGGSTNFIGTVQVSTSSPSSAVGVGDDLGPFFSEAPMFIAHSSSGGGGSNITASVALGTNDAIGAGTCIQKGATATGATTSMAVAISPQGDPTTVGLNHVIWNAWVDAPDHVTAQFCKFATGFAAPKSTVTFNIRVLGTSTAGTIGVVTLPSGTQVAGGSCVTSGGAVTGASVSNVVVMTPPTDPAAVGMDGIQFEGYVDSPGHVTAEVCKFGAGTFKSTASLNFNVALLN